MINLDQLYTRAPYNSFDGTELLVVHKAGVTGASLLSALKTFFKAGFVANDITNASTIGKQVLTAANLAAVQTLLEIPEPAPEPLAPVTLTANTTLTAAAHANRRVLVTSPVTLTTDKDDFTTTDTLTITNISSGNVTLDAGAGEDFRLYVSGSVVTTYTLAANYCLKAFLIDSNTWFIET